MKRGCSKMVFCLLLLVTGSATLCLAQNSESKEGFVTLEGMSFYCPSCRMRSDGYCEIEIEGALTRIECEQLLDYLLVREEQRKTRGNRPSVKFLASFLLERKRAYAHARASLKLLVRSKAGEAILRKYASPLGVHYSDIIAELVNEGWGSPETLMAFWKSSELQQNTRLRTLVAARHEQLGVEAIFAGLSVVHLSADEKLLREAAGLYKLIGDSNSAVFEEALPLLSICSGRADAEECSLDNLLTLESSAALYLQRVRLRAKMRERSTSPREDRIESAEPPKSSLAETDSLPMGIFLLLAVGIAAGLGFLVIRRHGDKLEEPEINLDRLERQELRELRRFFNLNPRAKEIELVKLYRERARDLHPDTGSGDADTFSLMTKKYKRARDLLARMG